jgi:predicted glycogen debranching enzyme
VPPKYDTSAEWLEPDGLGGFASGTVGGVRTRRYHALLLAAITPPTGRYVLVNGFDAWIESADRKYDISSQAYSPGVIAPDGRERIEEFEPLPWPRWRFLLDDGTSIDQELFSGHGTQIVCISWKINGNSEGKILCLRPYLSGRDYHALHHENSSFQFKAEIKGERITWHPYFDLRGILAKTNGTFGEDPVWYHNFQYAEEQARGLDYIEDLAAPGVLRWDLSAGEAVLILAAQGEYSSLLESTDSAIRTCDKIRKLEMKRRAEFQGPLLQSADAYIVKRGKGKTIVAGYPWFTDWGRDTFIAMRGLCLATGRLDVARQILLEWASVVSEGMLPNRFPDQGGTREYNSVDASLWYIVAVYDYLQTVKKIGSPMRLGDVNKLQTAIVQILNGYSKGTRFQIHADYDGLLASGQPGVQLTWMDAKVGDWVVTPRIGKPVEIQALWLNALWIGAQFEDSWNSPFHRALESFETRFWNDSRSCLFDVVDVDHQPGTTDALIRPNQIFTVGGLPLQILKNELARKIVDSVEAHLLTPLGLRSLAPGEPGYAPHYSGGVRERDGAYHQGTVWPWLIGPFVEAWIRVHGSSSETKKEAHDRFLLPILQHLKNAGINHISEVADAEPPFKPGGCPFQAWSVGEVIRVLRVVLPV